jgi:hypothetical protein
MESVDWEEAVIGNQAENRQFNGAVQEIERLLQRRLSRREKRRLHDAISGEGLEFREIVEVGVDLFGDGLDES